MADFKADAEVVEAILDGVTQVTRRAEIYESDGTTLWLPTADTPRLIEGSVSVDYSRSERRTFDAVFDNSDGVLRHDPNGFWYDKIIKIFRGIKYSNKKLQPSIIIIQDDSVTANRIYTLFKTLGYWDVTVKTATTLEELYGYDLVVAASGNSTITNGTLLASAFQAGFNILTAGNQNTSTQLPAIIATSIAKSTTVAWEINQVTSDNTLKVGWTSSTLAGNTTTGQHVTTLATGVRPVASYTWSGNPGYTIAQTESSSGARWLHFQLVMSPSSNKSLLRVLRNGIEWLYSYTQLREWEMQIGEFMIDKISTDHFPRTLSVSGRDYTKKLMLTKFRDSLTFNTGTDIDVLVTAIAANAGIKKFLTDSTGAALVTDMTFARGDDRWKAIQDCATASGVEVFFNAAGYLVTRKFKDPVTSPLTFALSLTGKDANLTKLNIESSDTSVFNTVVVTAETADGLSTGTFFQGVAVNEQPDSPTRVSRIGERTMFYDTAVAGSNAQCKMIAENFLRVSALEEFVLNVSALVFPWADAGDIISFANPDDSSSIPDRYLLTSVNIPLGLSPMDATCKRVTIVGAVSNTGGG